MKTALDLPHGLHDGIPEAIYHARVPGLVSKHALDLVRRSPAHYKAWLDGAETKDNDDFRLGRALHCALLEPERFASEYVVMPTFDEYRDKAGRLSTKEGKAERAAWVKAHEGCAIIEPTDREVALAMASAVRAHPTASSVLASGRAEVTARWHDEDTGLECKARADFFAERDPSLTDAARLDAGLSAPGAKRRFRFLVDVKTTDNAGPDAFARSSAAYGYHRQAAFYQDGFAVASGGPVDGFVFIVVEKAPPYAVALYMIDEAGMAMGRLAVRDAMEKLADCVERDAWAAYPEKIQVLSLPAWAA